MRILEIFMVFTQFSIEPNKKKSNETEPFLGISSILVFYTKNYRIALWKRFNKKANISKIYSNTSEQNYKEKMAKKS